MFYKVVYTLNIEKEKTLFNKTNFSLKDGFDMTACLKQVTCLY